MIFTQFVQLSPTYHTLKICTHVIFKHNPNVFDVIEKIKPKKMKKKQQKNNFAIQCEEKKMYTLGRDQK